MSNDIKKIYIKCDAFSSCIIKKNLLIFKKCTEEWKSCHKLSFFGGAKKSWEK